MKNRVAAAISLSVLMIAGCTGNPGTGGTVVTPTPTPTPSPTITPSPTPSPTPTPTASYTPFDQITADTVFSTRTTGTDEQSNFRSITGGDVPAYTVATQTWRFGCPDCYMPDEVVFTPANITASNADLIRYALASHPRGNLPVSGRPAEWSDPAWLPSLTLYKPLIGTTRLQYVRGFRAIGYSHANTSYFLKLSHGALGIGTRAQDSLSGTLTYRFQIYGSANGLAYDLTGSTGTASISPTGTITVQLVVVGTPKSGGPQVALETVNASGIVSAIQSGFAVELKPSNPVTLRDQNMLGSFYGPRGREIGGSLTFTTTSGMRITAGFAGLQD